MMKVFLVFVILWGSHLSEQSSHFRRTFSCSQHFDKQVCRLCILWRLNARNADSFLLWNSDDCLYLIPASRLNRVHKNQSLRTIFVKFMMINRGSGLNHDYPLFHHEQTSSHSWFPLIIKLVLLISLVIFQLFVYHWTTLSSVYPVCFLRNTNHYVSC